MNGNEWEDIVVFLSKEDAINASLEFNYVSSFLSHSVNNLIPK